MKPWIISLAGLGVLFAIAATGWMGKPAEADDGATTKSKQKDKASVWMEMKLEHTQGIVKGLAQGDFEMIRKHAGVMDTVGYFEKWVRADKPEYKRQTAFFEFANRELLRQAKAKNLEGATLAFNQLTVSCVQCHKVVRDVKQGN